MHTRCPQCQTTFALTEAQLTARGGLVRCGRCQTVFRADRSLVDAPDTRRRRQPVPGKQTEVVAPPVTAENSIEPPLVTDTTPYAPPARTRPAFWALGILLMLLGLATQALLFYSDRLIRRQPALEPVLAEICERLGCTLELPRDVTRIELMDTRVAPHPVYDRALRVYATLVNRAPFAQPLPILEVTLLDSRGDALARRQYLPRDYLPDGEALTEGMPPHLAIDVRLDITSPGGAAAGYEVRVVSDR